MNILHGLRTSINKNPNLWTIVWILIVLNIFMLLALSSELSLLLVIVLTLLGLVGVGIIRSMAESSSAGNHKIPAEFKAKIDELMADIRPLCDEIFTKKIDEFIEPVLEGMNRDFSQGLSWLWEDGEQFIVKVDDGINQTASMLRLIDSLSDEKCRVANQLNIDIDLLRAVVKDIRNNKEKNFTELKELLQNKVDELRTGMEKEKDIFYDYIYNLVIEQVKNNESDIDITDYFDTYKLGEQFGVILDKSMETRMVAFEESITSELENFSASVVGKLQKNMLQLTNIFKEMIDLLDHLIDECKKESTLLLRRMNECRRQIEELQEQSGDIMITLAWQDILVEKRWQEIAEKLYIIKDKVLENVDEEVIKYMNEVVEKEIPGFTGFARTTETALFYKSLVDSELIYQLIIGDKLMDIIENGVNGLLYYIRPVEFLVVKSLKLSIDGIKNRKMLKEQVKNDKYRQNFDKVKQVISEKNPALLSYIEGVYPRDFYTFCNNPYIKQRPGNFNQAAWMVFMELIHNDNNNDELYFLVGILLVIHKLRNKHINPLKSIPVNLEDQDELEHMRYACYQTISIILSNQVDGVVKISSKFIKQ